ncbi:unnamed protein product [Aphanomyces euteiches]
MVDAANVLNEEVGQLDAAQLSDNRGDALSNSTGSPANTIVLGSVHETTKPPASQRKSGAQQGRPKLAPPGNPPQSNWYPMPRLANVDEKDKMCTEFTILFNRIASEKKMSKETLEIRAAFPEYKLEKSDWMLAKKRTQQDDLVTIQCVARLPMDLLVSDSTDNTGKSATKQNSLAGFLLKRGEVNVTMQRRYMILADNELVYYKENPELNKGWFGKEKPRGSLHMGNVSLIRPYLDSLTLELVTNKRTWVLQAESEREYKAWARALCHCVPYEAVDVVFRRMFQLAEVDASNVNEVRLATLPSFTVQETVDHILINYLQMAGALPLKPHRPEDFFLKVTGYRDYMVNPSSPVSRYSHVQECLFTKKTLYDEAHSVKDAPEPGQDKHASYLNKFVKPVGVAQASNLGDFEYLVQLIQENPLFNLTGYEKVILWRHRRAFLGSFEALPRILSSVNWLDPEQVNEIVSILPAWTTPRHPVAYIALLDLTHAHVRQFAVEQLSKLTDSAFRQFLPQLVQALKSEAYHTSPLAGLLIERALKNPNQIGFDLFWCLKVETYQPQHQERFGLLLNSYVDVCSLKIHAILRFQEELFAEGGRLDKICIEVRRLKATNVSEREVTAKLHNLLDQLNETLPSSFQLPIDPRIEVGKLIVAKCYVMNSAKSPLWLEFENAEAGQQSTAVIFKSGEDLRQEMLILQLLRVIDDMWREDGKNFALEPYRCVCTGPHTGVIQAVPRSASSTEIQNRGHSTRGLLGAVTEDCYLVWIQEHNSSSRSQKTAMDLFMRSLAGYSVATYVLGLGNRQYDNIMMTHEGRVFLTDLSHFLGVYKYVPLLDMTLKRDPTPFVLTPQMSFVFGGEASPSFLKFIKLCGDAFNVVRQHLHLLVTLLVSMLPAELPELVDRESIQYIVETICPELDKTEAFLHFETLVRQIHSLKWNTASH